MLNIINYSKYIKINHLNKMVYLLVLSVLFCFSIKYTYADEIQPINQNNSEITSENTNNITNWEQQEIIDEKKAYLLRLKEIRDWFFWIKENEIYKKIWFDNTFFLVKSIWTNYDTEKYYKSVIKYLETKTDDKSKEYLRYIKENEFFFRLVLPWIRNAWYKSDLRNPLNNQWTFQINKFEKYLAQQWCSNDLFIYNDCSVVLDLYKSQKQLKEIDNILQYLDMVWYVKSTLWNFDIIKSNDNQIFGVKNQINILFDMLKIKYTNEELVNLIDSYDYKTRNFKYNQLIQSLYDKNTLQFNSVMITKPQNLKYIVELTFYNTISTIYDNIDNAWNIKWFGTFVYDNWYVSNNTNAWILFTVYKSKISKEKTSVSWYWTSFFSMLYAWDEKWYAFLLNTIQILKKNFVNIINK